MSMNLGGGVGWVNDRHSNSNDTHSTVVKEARALQSHTHPFKLQLLEFLRLGGPPTRPIPGGLHVLIWAVSPAVFSPLWRL